MARSDMLSQPDRGLDLDRPQTEAFHRRVQEADSRSPQRRKAQARGHGRVRPRQEHRGEAGQADKRDRLAARRRQPRARAEPDPGARAREPQAPDGGRHLKTSGAGIRSEVRAMAANGGRYPISAQRGHRGIPHGPRQRVRQRREQLDARGLRHRGVAVGQGPPPRQRRRRVGRRDTEGRARPPRGVRNDARAPGQALGLRAPVRQLQDSLGAGLHVAGRAQGDGAVPPESSK